MLIKQRIQTYVGVIVALAVAIVFLTAMQSSQAGAQAANTLKITPLRSDLTINRGESKTVEITVTNLTDKAINVHPVSNDFIAGDENGTPALILDENKFAPTHSLKRFMQPLEDASIPAGQSKTFNLVIAVPASAASGGYYGAIRFAPTDPDTGGQVNLSGSVASLILATVPGETVDKMTLTNFDVQKDGKTAPFYFDGKNMQVLVRFMNEGNVQSGPFGKISVKKGDEIVYESDFNTDQPRDMVLPDSARRWQVPIENADSFGHYTVYGTFTYGDSNQTIEVTKSFWVIPPFILYIAAGGLLLIIGIIVTIILLARRGGGGRNRRYTPSSRGHRF